MKRKNIRRKMPERQYRASRVCRVLGNPTAYRLIKLLSKNKMTPSQLSEKLGISLSTTSGILRNLRQIDLVRYDIRWKEKIYWLKNKKILEILDSLEKFTEKLKFIKH